MTASALKGDREKCLAAGMEGYISKPTRIEAIREALEGWARRDDVTRAEYRHIIGAGISYHLYNKNGKDQ